MDRSNHYEGAFEAYLQWHRLCYVAVDEARRSLWGDDPLKSVDFIVFGAGGDGLLVDVKGRRYPAGPPGRPRRQWECWSTAADVEGLERWQKLFGPGFRSLLVFAYDVDPAEEPPGLAEELWAWRGRRYLFRAVAVSDYRPHLRVRSRRWQTVTLPRAAFRALARPFDAYTRDWQPAAEECPF